ncbi:hypothetical protein B0H11DRAFT_824475 [Mycena galericulata]|nr:hypothetical protein B0H11DRAFT_824475 [Mycena galericulata]
MWREGRGTREQRRILVGERRDNHHDGRRAVRVDAHDPVVLPRFPRFTAGGACETRSGACRVAVPHGPKMRRGYIRPRRCVFDLSVNFPAPLFYRSLAHPPPSVFPSTLHLLTISRSHPRGSSVRCRWFAFQRARYVQLEDMAAYLVRWAIAYLARSNICVSFVFHRSGLSLRLWRQSCYASVLLLGDASMGPRYNRPILKRFLPSGYYATTRMWPYTVHESQAGRTGHVR